ncbi:hypothetical protein GC177_08135 [bacterium]|nr:hypothetical protein [bacterium]
MKTRPLLSCIAVLLTAAPAFAQSQWLDKDAAISRRAARSHYYYRMQQVCEGREGAAINAKACAKAKADLDAVNRGAMTGTYTYTTPPSPAFCDAHPDAWDCSPNQPPAVVPSQHCDNNPRTRDCPPDEVVKPAKPWKIPE